MKKLLTLLTMLLLLMTWSCGSGGDDVVSPDEGKTEKPDDEKTEQPDNGKDEGADDGKEEDNPDDDTPIEEAVFEIDSDGNYVVEADGGTIKVKVTTNLEYSVTIPEDAKMWLSVADTRAIRNETLTFSVAKNEMTKERHASVKIKDPDGALLQSIVFKQKYNEADESTGGPISVSKGRVSFDFEGGECELTVNAEYSWVASCTADWITLQTPDGIAGQEPLKFIVQRNTALSERKATITLKNENYNLIQEVYVVQTEFVPIITVNEESLSLEYAACEKFIEVTSNVEYNVTDDADWLTCEVVEGGINLSVTDNHTLETRSAQVTIAAKENPEAPTTQVSVVQMPPKTTQYVIYYTSSDGEIVNPKQFAGTLDFGANLIGNGYSDNQGVLMFDAPITSIGYCAFEWCPSLTSITIPDSVTSIGDYAFYNCTSLTSITIPDNVTKIGDSAFSGCASLTDVYVNIKDLARYAQKNALSIVPGHKHLYVKGVEITELVIPDSVTSIGEGAFQSCTALTSVTIPERITEIKSLTFAECSSLTNITIPDSVTEIGSEAFSGCASLTDVYVNITDLARYAQKNALSIVPGHKHLYVKGVEITELVIPDSVTSIGDYAFKKCSMKSITIPNSVTEIGRYAFEDCIGELIINTKIIEKDYTGHNNHDNNGWLSGSGFSNLTIGENVEKIGDYAFSGYIPLKSITIPNSVTEIGRYAFYECTLLTSITIPDSVTKIGDSAFEWCDSLTSITIPDSVTSIGYYAFRNCTSLTSITIPDSVTSIGYYAFRNCTSLTSITIPDSVAEIGCEAFHRCSSLTSVTIGNSVMSIGQNAFEDCSSLTSIAIPDSVTEIGSYAFCNCDSLTNITIPDSVTKIGRNVFLGCDSLTSVTIGDSVTRIEKGAFTSCISLESITIGDSVRSIGEDAFGGNTSLKEVYCKPTTPPAGYKNMFMYYSSNLGLWPINCKIYVPTNSVEAYKAANYWSEYSSRIVGYDF